MSRLRNPRTDCKRSSREHRLLLQYVSDLHLEVIQSSYSSFHIPPTPSQPPNGNSQPKTLILAGDIGRLVDSEKLLQFLERCAADFDHVLYVLGNHEFYHSSHEATIAAAQRLVESPSLQGRVSLLHRGRVDLDARLTVLGCTLWSRIPSKEEDDETRLWTQMKLADFRQIEGWSTARHTEEYVRDLAWLRGSIERMADEEPERRIVVVTHHAPTAERTSDPKFEGNKWNCAFRTEILGGEEFKAWHGREKVVAWVFGHTHFSTDFVKEGIRVVANQRGYVLPNGQKELKATGKEQERPKGGLLSRLRGYGKKATPSDEPLAFDQSKNILV